MQFSAIARGSTKIKQQKNLFSHYKHIQPIVIDQRELTKKPIFKFSRTYNKWTNFFSSLTIFLSYIYSEKHTRADVKEMRERVRESKIRRVVNEPVLIFWMCIIVHFTYGISSFRRKRKDLLQPVSRRRGFVRNWKNHFQGFNDIFFFTKFHEKFSTFVITK